MGWGMTAWRNKTVLAFIDGLLTNGANLPLDYHAALLWFRSKLAERIEQCH